MRTPTGLISLTAAAVVAAACTGGGATASPSAASPSPTPVPSPSAEGADFTIEVLPAEDPVEGRPAIPGEKVVFLVVVTSDSEDPVAISATATGAKIDRIEPAELKPGVVGEVWVVPDAATEEARITTEITATRGSVTRTEKRTTQVMPFEDDRAEQAQPYFDMWVDWLAANQPEFGITRDTQWDSSYVLGLLIVSHYAYFSDEWEMKISWDNSARPPIGPSGGPYAAGRVRTRSGGSPFLGLPARTVRLMGSLSPPRHESRQAADRARPLGWLDGGGSGHASGPRDYAQDPDSLMAETRNRGAVVSPPICVP